MADSVATLKPSLPARLTTFYNGVMTELRKVTWPNLPEVRSATIAIIIFVLVIALAITFMDFILQSVLLNLIPSLFAK